MILVDLLVASAALAVGQAERREALAEEALRVVVEELNPPVEPLALYLERRSRVLPWRVVKGQTMEAVILSEELMAAAMVGASVVLTLEAVEEEQGAMEGEGGEAPMAPTTYRKPAAAADLLAIQRMEAVLAWPHQALRYTLPVRE